MGEEPLFTDEEPVWTSTSGAVDRLYERSADGECALLCPACTHRFRVAPAEGFLRNTAVSERIRFIRAAVGLVSSRLNPPNRQYRIQGFDVVLYSGRPDKVECFECEYMCEAEDIIIEIKTPRSDQQQRQDE